MQILIEKGDITQVKAEAIVNAANSQLRNGAGTCGAIHRAAGPELETWSKHFTQNRGNVLTGEAVSSPSFLMNNCDVIIHAVGPIYSDSPMDSVLLECAYINSFLLASKLGIKSIAFPAISTGVYGFPMDKALIVLEKALKTTSYNGKVILVPFNSTDLRAYKKVIKPWKINLSRLRTRF